MNRRRFKLALVGFSTICLIGWGCTKLDTTTLGSDLLPAVDNVNTFADTIDIDAYQEDFLPGDTTSITSLETHVLGNISSDPVFGTTNAELFVQFKPNFYPYYFGQMQDTIYGPGTGLDSVILCLSYNGAWGDTAQSIQLNVKEIPENTTGEWDSLYLGHRLSYAPPTGALIGAKSILINDLTQQVKFAHGRDSVKGQIRIKLDQTWAENMFRQDSGSIIGPYYLGNAFRNDSLFGRKFEGLAIEATSGNALIYTSLTSTNTRLEFHYRKRRSNVIDTVYNSLFVNTIASLNVKPSATANRVSRNRTLPGVAGTRDNEIYLQTTPGTYARLKIPRLDTYRDTNKIIHRAQIRIFQIPENQVLDNTFTPPNFLYLDLKDTTLTEKHKPIYLDLNPSYLYNPDRSFLNVAEPYFPFDLDFNYYGGFMKTRTDPVSNTKQSYYDFNITRYLQKMLKSEPGNKVPNYELRLFAPYSFSYPKIDPAVIQYPNNLAQGRVKVGGSAGSGSYKMQLVVIYSKLP